jgi:hypothetical protein
VTTQEAFWIFQSIDPATGQEPLDALLGFLPVKDTTNKNGVDSLPSKGEGFVTFSIKPSFTAQSNDTTTAQAGIVFDFNAPVMTNIEKHTIDPVTPTSSIHRYSVTQDTITLNWSGVDNVLGAGLKSYALYFSENGGPYSLFRENLSDTTGYFVGTMGNSYSFITLAIDSVGNQEPMKTSNVSILIPNDKVVTSNLCPLSNTTFTAPSIASGTYQWQVDMGSGFQNVTNSIVYDGSTGQTLLLKEPPTSWYGYKYRCQITSTNNVYYSVINTLKFSMTWKGTQSDSWETPANWSCNMLPDEFTDVLINTIMPVQLRSNAAVRSIVLYPGANLTISAPHNLEIKGMK